MSNIRIFISHAKLDEQLAEKFVLLFRLAFNIQPDLIRCTSLAANGYPPGTDIVSALREEAVGAEVLVALVSTCSMDSTAVLFELGARWGVGRTTLPIFCCGASPKQLPYPISGKIAADCTEDGLETLLTTISSEIAVPLNKRPTYRDALENVIKVNSSLEQERIFKPQLQRPSCIELFKSRVAFHTKLDETPWDVYKLLDNPVWTSVWLVSQNLGGLVRDDASQTRFSQAVLKALETKDVGIMVSTPEMMYDNPHYRGYLVDRAIPFLKRLRTQSKKSRRLTVCSMPDAGTISGNFVKDAKNNGVAIVNAKFALSSTGNRTYFIVEKELHVEAYTHFRSSLDDIISRIGPNSL